MSNVNLLNFISENASFNFKLVNAENSKLRIETFVWKKLCKSREYKLKLQNNHGILALI